MQATISTILHITYYIQLLRCKNINNSDEYFEYGKLPFECQG